MTQSQKYKEFKKSFDTLIKNSKRVYITAHINPDGDAISSVLSLYYYVTEVLKVSKDKVYPIFTGPYNDTWEYFKNYEKVKFVSDIAEVIKKDSTVIFLDGKEIFRFTNKGEEFGKIKNLKTVCIDHHSSPNTDTFNLSYLVEETKHMSNAEILYSMFFRDMLKSTPAEVCKTLLLGMYTDSGNFRYVDALLTDCMIYSAEIIKEKNIKPDQFLSSLYIPKVKCLNAEGYFYKNLSSKKIDNWPSFVYTYISKDDAAIYSSKVLGEAVGAIKDRIKYAKEGEWSFIIRPDLEEKTWRFSLRSTPKSDKQINVKDITLFFGGGGHNAAAGFELKGEEYWNTSVDKVLQVIFDYLKTHKPNFID